MGGQDWVVRWAWGDKTGLLQCSRKVSSSVDHFTQGFIQDFSVGGGGGGMMCVEPHSLGRVRVCSPKKYLKFKLLLGAQKGWKFAY